MYLHDVNLGDPLDEEDLQQALGAHGDSPAVRVIMQLLRNRAADSDRAARDEPEHRELKCGEAKAYEEVFWFLFQHTHSAFVSRDTGAAGPGTPVDPDEAEHASDG
jgi:hypothetical protein